MRSVEKSKRKSLIGLAGIRRFLQILSMSHRNELGDD